MQHQHGEKKAASEKAKKSGKGHMPILAAIVVALILVGLFALPMLMPSPMGGRPPGQGAGLPPGAGQFGAPQGQLPPQQDAIGPASSS
jgi:hypothetical protein